jgi:glucose-6-phosphate 1-dehydrogenase
MVVTHLFQILAFMAMEPPTSLEPAPISEEKNKVFRSMLPIEPKDVVRGQYTGYRSEEGVDPESDTETFIALKCSIDNWRWAGVPFFLRTGKRLAEGQRIISIAFPRAAQEHVSGRVGRRRARPGPSDVRSGGRLENVAVVLRQAPGPGHAAGQAEPAVRHARHRHDRRRARGLRAPDPRRDARRPHAVHHRRGHRAAVGGLDPVAGSPPPVRLYPPGSWGPKSIHQLVAPHAWRLPFERAWRV